MNREMMIQAWAAFGRQLSTENEELAGILRQSAYHNPWFSHDNLILTIAHFKKAFLDEDKLREWLVQYPEPAKQQKRVGLILAGNIPFVGMHDIMCVLSAGHTAVVKLSSKDLHFFPWMKAQLQLINPVMANQIQLEERISDIDSVIATGSNNSSRYFDYYFGKYPHIFRKNRTSVAILDGSESADTLQELGKDVFTYYGLGCRNVSKLLLPSGYDPGKLLSAWESFSAVKDHNKYKNNLDYNVTLLLLNNQVHYASAFLALTESEELHAPLSTLYYAFYSDEQDLAKKLTEMEEDVQCIVSNRPGNTLPGQTQFPGLLDYADHVDTMEFLHNLPDRN
jgi:hypothetical protein